MRWLLPRVGSWRGIPIRFHLMIPLTFLFFGRRSLWGALAVLVLILVHEVGHAVMVRRYGAKVLTIDLLPFGGECSWQGEVTALQRALIAWGGVWAQADVFVPTLALTGLGLVPFDEISAAFAGVFLWSNLWMMAFNLIPTAPLDGSKAWVALPLAWRRRQARRAAARDRAVSRTLERLDQLEKKPVPDDVRDAVKKLLDDARR